LFEEPVVARPASLKLQGAQRVGDVLERVDEAVGEVVGRVDAPLLAGAGMLGELDAVGDLDWRGRKGGRKR